MFQKLFYYVIYFTCIPSLKTYNKIIKDEGDGSNDEMVKGK